eukprot:TRINITY_DN740_c0_g1_i2.p1 TRINITY_DN740_c0_g1~~TRINITY_DN740_c0_g1_i2.p1  ORF type:complete len:273 (+),score=30.33 TRINITY_DN740_c0_g1_i2:33-851(+)
MKIASVASLVVVIFGFAAVVSFAQPAGVYEMSVVSSSASCAMSKTLSIDLARTGAAYSCSASTPSGSTYRGCNSTHVYMWTCSSSDCSGTCTIAQGTVLEANRCVMLAAGLYTKSMCINSATSGFFGGVIAQIDTKNARLLRETNKDNNTPPSCDVNSDGFRELHTRASMSCDADNGGRYGYTTCNTSTATYWNCTDAACTNCVAQPYDISFTCPTTAGTFTFDRCFLPTIAAPVAEAPSIKAPAASAPRLALTTEMLVCFLPLIGLVMLSL